MTAIYQRLQIEKANGLLKPIRDKTLTDEDIVCAQSGKIDYLAMDDALSIAIAEAQGMRYSQEDRVAYGELESLSKLLNTASENKIEQSLTNIIAKLQAQCGQQFSAGSTLLATIIHKQKIYTLTLGDSVAFAVIFDAKGKITFFQRLNRELHNPIGQHYIYLPDGRGLAMTRSIGDIDFERVGLTHEPDIYVDDLTIPLDGKAYVIVACDGLTEATSQTDIQKILAKNHNQPLDEIVLQLLQQAFHDRTHDNVSVLITQINENTNIAKYLAVFDGHGGDTVSECLRVKWRAAFI